MHRLRVSRAVRMYSEDVEAEKIGVLGQGSYGFVMLVKSNSFPNQTDQYFAKKTSFISNAENLHKEIRILSRFNVPNIVKCVSPLLYLDYIQGIEVCSVYLEYASKGTLSDIIERNGGRLSENDVRCCTRMILHGLMALHAQGYVHCDLKASNILACPSRVVGEICELKIADFGLSKEPEECGFLTNSMCRGTPKYMSPESMGSRARIVSGLDIWSLGCVVLEMFGVKEVTKGEGYFVWKVPDDISEEGKDFVSKARTVNLSERWSAEWLMTHSFVTQRRNL